MSHKNITTLTSSDSQYATNHNFQRSKDSLQLRSPQQRVSSENNRSNMSSAQPKITSYLGYKLIILFFPLIFSNTTLFLFGCDYLRLMRQGESFEVGRLCRRVHRYDHIVL